MSLNENNIQAPFQYKVGENDFELLTRNGELELNTNNVQVKVFSGQRLFCADIGYAVDGALEEMEFLIDDIKVYPILLDELKDLQSVEVKDNEIYLIKNDINFKSIIFFPPIDLNKNFKYTITTYSSTFSSFMFDEIAKKLNIIDMNIPIKNYYEDTDYKINDVIKYNGYLYRVFREFTSDGTDYYLHSNCNLITPFKKLELGIRYKINDLAEYNNNFFTVQKGFTYEASSNLNELLKPIEDFIEWNDEIKKVYKNQIILKDNFCYLVLQTSENYLFDELIQFKRIDYLNKASNTFYDDENSNLGNETNTVQKAIEKLNNTKQNNLISGSNINIDGNTINVNSGVSKDYSIGSGYLTNDLIIYDNRLYIVNENFISSDWQTDKNKLTLLTSSGSLSTASQVAYDNNKTNLEYASGYSFPKFKYTIPDTINLVLTDNTNDYTAAITKQADGSYMLTCIIDNPKQYYFIIKSIDDNGNLYYIYNIMRQFFEFNYVDFNYKYVLEDDECSIDGVQADYSVYFLFNSGMCYFYLNVENPVLTDDSVSSPIINFNIKNRVLINQDTNLFCFTQSFFTAETTKQLFNLQLTQNNGSIKLIGSYTLKEGEGNQIGFYNELIENYFNLSSDLKSTEEITSSNNKKIKYTITKTSYESNDLYMILLGYDGTEEGVQVGDTITFNLTPDKNSTADPIYSTAENVQNAIEAIVQRLVLLESANKNI